MAHSDVAFPFRVSSFTEEDIEPWHWSNSERIPVAVNTSVPGWDYFADLRFQRHCHIDLDRIRHECGLEGKAPLQLAVIWSCSRTMTRQVEWVSESSSEPRLSVRVEIVLPSTRIAESITIETVLYLPEKGEATNSLVPHRRGTPLCQERVEIFLEGSGSRFPVEIVPFSSSLTRINAADAYWYLDFIERDLFAPVMRAIRVYLNADHEDIVDRLNSGEIELQRALSGAIISETVQFAIQEQEFSLDEDSFPPESMGEWAQSLVRSAFPGLDVDDLRSQFTSRHSMMSARIQSTVYNWFSNE